MSGPNSPTKKRKRLITNCTLLLKLRIIKYLGTKGEASSPHCTETRI